MKVELSTDDLRNVLLSLQNLPIKGQDAPIIAVLLEKIGKAFEKSAEKDLKTQG